MPRPSLLALVLGALTAGIASPQSIPSDLVTYLNLNQTQIQSINTLNAAFNQYTYTQDRQGYDLQSQVNAELAKASPDPGVVGNLYSQIEMLSRANKTQLAQLQTNVAAVLTPNQIAQVGALLNIARLLPLESEAQQVYMEPAIPTALYRAGNFSVGYAGNSLASCCYTTPIPIALVNYLNLSDAQSSAILNAIEANQNYVDGQSLKIQELQYAIQALTAAQTIDTATLGADYVAIAQIQRDETTQAGQLMTTVRSVLTDQQQPQLKALDNALSLQSVVYEAVESNILVLPPDLTQSNGLAGFLLGISTTGTIY